jgi:hypothetical protein
MVNLPRAYILKKSDDGADKLKYEESLMIEVLERLNGLFKTCPTKCELLDLHRVVIYFGDVIVKANIEEKGSCIGKYYKWSLDTEVSENGGKEYTPYRSYLIIEPLKHNKHIRLKELMKAYTGREDSCGF